MPFYISPNTLKQQVKLVVKHWPFTEIKSHQARLLLCKLYGYKDHHHYLKAADLNGVGLISIDESVVLTHYLSWVKSLAELASINQIQSKNLLHILWPGYLESHQYLSEKLYNSRFQFHGSCIDFLSDIKAGEWVNYRFDDRPSVKDSIEALGVPHPEVGGICVNGEWVDFSYLLNNKDNIEVYPHPHESALLPYKPSGEMSFLLDVHLARLARYLRMAGFNCLHETLDLGDELLAHLSQKNDYILLTRDKGLLKRGNVKFARWIRNTDPVEQFKEVVSYYDLALSFKPFARCVKCNGKIVSVDKSLVESVVPDGVFESENEFRQCEDCDQVYWKGSHYDKIKAILDMGSRE